MTYVQPQADAVHLPIDLDAAIAEHGAWRVLSAALRALVRRRKPAGRHDLLPLNDHLLRDIGMPPVHSLPSRNSLRL